jgi:predicted nucleic acid-binding protein
MSRFSLDSNVLIYVADSGAQAKQSSAQQIVALATNLDCVLTAQSLAEFFHAATRKRITSRQHAVNLVRDWVRLFPIVGSGPDEVLEAVAASNSGRFQFYDALLVATAATAGCSAVISEDMHPGSQLNGAQIVAALDGSGAISPATRSLLGLRH